MTELVARIEVNSDATTCTIVFSGELDILAAAKIVSTGQQAIRETNAPTIVLDLTKVTFVDSSALGALVSLKQEADGKGRRMELRGLTPQVRKVLCLTGLDVMFGIVADTGRS